MLPSRSPPLVVVGRSRIATRWGVVAAAQPLAAQAGAQILALGGNAVDAAIATNAVTGVVEPFMNGIGGDLNAIVYVAKTKQLYGLNATGWSPAALTLDHVKSCRRGQIVGIDTVTVPGAVAGWEALRTRFGKLAMDTTLAAAIHYAEDGFPVSDEMAYWWARSGEPFAKTAEFAGIYKPAGQWPGAGEVFRNPAVAKSLRLVAARGRAGFYEGEIASAIVSLSHELGGLMSAQDLREYTPEWVEPIAVNYRGWRVSELPPNTQGIAALIMLNIMERFDLSGMGFHGPQALHVMIEAKKLAYAEMLRYVGDPRFSDIPTDELLSREHADRLARRINLNRANCHVEPSRLSGFSDIPSGETTYMAAIDREGNVVSLIQSVFGYFGSGLVPAGTGFVLQNRGIAFSLVPQSPNVLAPRKRPFHTIIPGFMEKDGVQIGFGIMRGLNQAQAQAQFVANIADYGMDIQQALEAGRFAKHTFEGCDVDVEALVPEKTRAELVSMGHRITVQPPRSGLFGYGHAVMGNGEVHFGAAEPRWDGAAIPEPPPVNSR
jgi:gamma-glutamyltranspeptidase / glutathione hydrolase